MSSTSVLSPKEHAFFTLQLKLSLLFSGLLGIVLIVFFVVSQWQTYQMQTQAFRAQYTHNQFDNLRYHLFREQQLLQELYRSNALTGVQKTLFLNRLRTLRFGPGDQGYYFVLKLNNINGGEDFARHLLMPPNPKEEGVPMASDFKDIKGFAYREAYLKQLAKQGFAEVSYWYKKPDENLISQKVSYITWIKGLDWIIGAGLYNDDLERVVALQKAEFQGNFIKQLVIAVSVTLSFLLVAWLVYRRTQRVLQNQFILLKQENETYQKRLQEFNKELSIEVAQKTQALEHIYRSDPLTGLFNRAKLVLDLNENLAQSWPKPMVLIMLNIDNFKELNDVFGFETGDKLLVEIAQSLKDYVPAARYYYRVSGDEFVILLDALPEEIESCLYSLHKKITREMREESLQSISFNVTLVAVQNADAPLNQLEMTMNLAKKHRKNVLVYSPRIDQKSLYQNNLMITKMLRAAIQLNQVVPYYQPILNCDTGKIEKYECLIRIENDKGCVTPVEFLQIAKKSKLYEPLMVSMLEKSFATFSQTEYLDYDFSVNLSYEDIIGQEIPITLNRLITPHNAKRINFEILETEGIENYALVSRFIQQLKVKGSSIAIDDYGSGYSNLEHLIKLNVDIIKLDGTLIQNLPQPHAMAIVNSVVIFAKQLNIKTIAEFVSNETLYDLVKSLGVDYAQGYYIGRPNPIPQTQFLVNDADSEH